jgi:hypothetical protein
VSSPAIVGIVLARNEDIFIRRAIENAAAFCDAWIFCDHDSQDGTADILKDLAASLPRAEYHRIAHPSESHDLIAPYAGSDSWIFGLDGDEIYEASRLARLRSRIVAGKFHNDWMLLGNVLHVTALDISAASATGHLAPPSRSMTKLYNFSHLQQWPGPCPERLHGGTPVFKEGRSADARRMLYGEASWEDADFRCLHLCFLHRSSLDKDDAPRTNIMEQNAMTPLRRVLSFVTGSSPAQGWKQERYGRGPAVTVDASEFFPH